MYEIKLKKDKPEAERSVSWGYRYTGKYFTQKVWEGRWLALISSSSCKWLRSSTFKTQLHFYAGHFIVSRSFSSHRPMSRFNLGNFHGRCRQVTGPFLENQRAGKHLLSIRGVTCIAASRKYRPFFYISVSTLLTNLQLLLCQVHLIYFIGYY